MISVNCFTNMMVLLMVFSTYHAYPTKEAWPEECKGRTYCHIQPAYYPKDVFAKLLTGMKVDFEQANDLDDRSGEIDDIAKCSSIQISEKFYLILDENDQIRFVAQNEDTFIFKIQVEECAEPGRTRSSSLNQQILAEKRVDCYETRHPFMFPVLSLDGTKIESVAPKDGIPLSCSAKVMA